MIEFTKEEISLCKQVAEKHRKEMREGDWIAHVNSDEPNLVRDKESIPYLNNEFQVPLWTISDCLEFLEKEGFNQDFHFKRFKNGNWSFTAEDNKYKKVRGEGETKRASCLKAVLAVLVEGK